MNTCTFECEQWNTRASVKDREIRYNASKIKQQDLFNAGRWFGPWLKDLFEKKYERLTNHQAELLGALRFIHFFKFTEELERNIITSVMNKISNDSTPDLETSENKRLTNRYMTDEAYEIFLSMQAFMDASSFFKNQTQKRSHRLQSICQFQSSLDPVVVHFLFVIISESNTTADLTSRVPTIPQSPIKDMIIDYLEDKQTHVQFFSQLWHTLDQNDKTLYVSLLPDLIQSVHYHDLQWLVDAGNKAQVCPELIQEVIDRNSKGQQFNTYVAKQARHISYFFKKHGLCNNLKILDWFKAHEFL